MKKIQCLISQQYWHYLKFRSYTIYCGVFFFDTQDSLFYIFFSWSFLGSLADYQILHILPNNNKQLPFNINAFRDVSNDHFSAKLFKCNKSRSLKE